MNNFRQDSIDFLNGKLVNMGSWQYDDHEGTRNGVSTSGFKLWSEADQKRAAANGGQENMASAERAAARAVAEEIERDSLLPEGLHTVEMGPGTKGAFRDQTETIMNAFHAAGCTIVDRSQGFLDEICADDDFAYLKPKAIQSDFWKSEGRYYDGEALLIMFGTISNLDAPVNDNSPKAELAETLRKLADRIREGWLLLSFDSDQDGEKIKSYYHEHPVFQLNIFDRMKVEGIREGWLDDRFDNLAFDYLAEWHADSGQLAHMAVLNRDMSFTLDGKEVSFKKGDKLHIKNSFKFMPEFFEECCPLAGLDVVRGWVDSSVKFYLLKKVMPEEVPQFRPQLEETAALRA